IIGKRRTLELVLVGVLARGHVLLEDVPGTAKTSIARGLARVLGLRLSRIQFTPDLMPADVTGSAVYDRGSGQLHFQPGPLFANLVLGDEINRAPPKTQAALLEAMQERTVTVANTIHVLEEPFFVLATQNPIEMEGTYPLPEAQLDRFIMQIDVSYPELEAERRMLAATTGVAETLPESVMGSDDLLAAQRLIRRIPVGTSVVDAILRLVRQGRPETSELAEIREQVAWGPGPRASQALMLAVRARAVLEGRLAPSVEDVLALCGAVLRHRMALNFAARADGITIDHVIDRLAAPLT
ncbi:MAG TPA: AAA family ATPase, partial [Alphaproteobacteria bacterium]|nr:AAA family ATPase [Alphaproteobacteria bacterium]